MKNTLLHADSVEQLDQMINSNPGSERLAVITHPSGVARYAIERNNEWKMVGPEWKSRGEALVMLEIMAADASEHQMIVTTFIEKVDEISKDDPRTPFGTIPDSEWINELNKELERQRQPQQRQPLTIHPDDSQATPVPVRINHILDGRGED